ncbi:unnamed protein product [Orchesella dallaii]|uniref:Uncharacterized protein n=1 Tax=Orchesella dallaii TaxID=48710 RepID=A0ABP1RSR4_9HEXA
MDYRWDFPWSNVDEWQWENVDGPECFLCGEEARADQQLVKHDGVMYTLVFEKESFNCDYVAKSFAPHHKGFLQCSYCFNFFHRHKCILSLSEKTYFQYKCSRGWSCPTCIPDFEVKYVDNKKQQSNLSVNFNCLLSIFKAMYHLSNFLGQSPFYGIFELRMCLHGLFYAVVWSIDTG